jgi:FtsH-binding integral membrane protein
MSNMDTPPVIRATPPPLEKRNSFFHHAATYCLLAPFVALGANIVIAATRTADPHPTRIEVLVPAIILTLIILSGFVFGVISLFGIRRYGKAGILWKAVMGLLIVIIMFSLAIPSFLRARAIARERYEQQYGHPPP